MLTIAGQESLHRLCTANRAALANATRAGCFYCCEVFMATEAVDFVDGRQPETGDLADGVTALCPRCGIDSVIPEVGNVVLTEDLLAEMKAYWF